MNSTLRLAILASLGAIGPFLAQESKAVDAAPVSSDALETIVVTAEKREETLKDVPMSVTALSSATLENLTAKNFQDYAALIPGLSLQTSQPGLRRLTLRGQNAGGGGSPAAVS